MHKVMEVKPLSNYRIWIKFMDGVEGTVNLSDVVGKGVFAKFKQEHYFTSVFVDQNTHTVAWPGGVDLCPDSLYAEITGNDLSSILQPETHSAKV